jgi:hypothetical protein
MLSALQQLLSDLVRTPSLICTVGRSGAIGELFLKEAPQKIEFSGDWAAVECPGWHLHVNLAAVVHVRFLEEAGHDQSVSPVVLFEDSLGQAVMRFYFPHASHTHTTYTVEELALFEQFKERYQKRLETGDYP